MSKQNNNNKHLRAHINKQANKRKKQNKQTKETTTKIIHLLSGARTCDFGLFPYTCVTGVNTKPYHI